MWNCLASLGAIHRTMLRNQLFLKLNTAIISFHGKNINVIERANIDMKYQNTYYIKSWDLTGRQNPAILTVCKYTEYKQTGRYNKVTGLLFYIKTNCIKKQLP